MRVIIFTTDGQSREDGNVYYSSYVVVEAVGALAYSEPLFREDQTMERYAWVLAARTAGYKVAVPPSLVVTQP